MASTSPRITQGVQIAIDGFSDAVKDILGKYSDEVIDATSEAAEVVAARTRAKLREGGPYRDRSGDYTKSWRVTKLASHSRFLTPNYVVNAAPPHYRLTHLLEKSHRVVGFGGSHGNSKAFPHIGPAEEFAALEMRNEVLSRIERIS